MSHQPAVPASWHLSSSQLGRHTPKCAAPGRPPGATVPSLAGRISRVPGGLSRGAQERSGQPQAQLGGAVGSWPRRAHSCAEMLGGLRRARGRWGCRRRPEEGPPGAAAATTARGASGQAWVVNGVGVERGSTPGLLPIAVTRRWGSVYNGVPSSPGSRQHHPGPRCSGQGI